MTDQDLQELVRKRPFEPLRISLSDGRKVLVQHPEQCVVSRRHVYFSLEHLKRDRAKLSTPSDREEIGVDWLLVDLIHVVSAEPAGGGINGSKSKNGRRRAE